MSDSGKAPGLDYLVTLRDAVFGPDGAFPDIIWDGVIDPKTRRREVICVDNGDAQLLDIDAINEFANPSLDMTPYQCRVEKLSALSYPLAGGSATVCRDRGSKTYGRSAKKIKGQRLNRFARLMAFCRCLLLAACGPAEVTFHTADDYPASVGLGACQP